ncbi:MAG TPA: DUF418 domain-containing protein [Phycisphaerales bacterium]|nr:DUF418 domain-containing protein [Phycisphaerales bacterium]
MSHSLAPTAGPERIGALDLIRGVALLGILFVNIQVFGEAFGTYTVLKPEADEGSAGAAAFCFVAVFCATKFYPIFSMLFGVGLAVQWSRAVAQGRSYTAYGVRRLLSLMVVGLAHGLLIWYGDILFAYLIAGLLTLPLLKAKPKTLLIVAGCILALSTLISAAFAAVTIGMAQPPNDAAAAAAMLDPSLPPFDRFWEVFASGQIKAGPQDPLWTMPETEAMREGPWAQAFYFRALSFAFILFIMLIGMGWGIWALFLTGVALYKLGFFTPSRAAWHRRLAAVSLPVGLAMASGAHLMMGDKPGPLVMFGAGLLGGAGAIATSLGYVGALMLFAHSAALSALKGTVSKAGRMGLTSYLLESVIATALFYHWGLQWFGETTRMERMVLVLLIYLAVVLIANVWLRVFLYGPMEWLWRTVTYLRPQPMLRRAGTPLAAAAS